MIPLSSSILRLKLPSSKVRRPIPPPSVVLQLPSMFLPFTGSEHLILNIFAQVLLLLRLPSLPLPLRQIQVSFLSLPPLMLPQRSALYVFFVNYIPNISNLQCLLNRLLLLSLLPGLLRRLPQMLLQSLLGTLRQPLLPPPALLLPLPPPIPPLALPILDHARSPRLNSVWASITARKPASSQPTRVSTGQSLSLAVFSLILLARQLPTTMALLRTSLSLHVCQPLRQCEVSLTLNSRIHLRHVDKQLQGQPRRQDTVCFCCGSCRCCTC